MISTTFKSETQDLAAGLANNQPAIARIRSVDILRGIVMIVMAIDHVRVYSGIPAGGITAGIFLTRWITHYCAPTFAFFAGTSAFLYFTKSGSKTDVIRFLLTRGLVLIVLELTLVRFFWTFNFDYASFTITGVIWMLGWCMILLAAFIPLRPIVTAFIGIAIICGQQLFQYVPFLFPASFQETASSVWAFFYPVASSGKQLVIGSGSAGLPAAFGISVFYVIIPWIGAMMAGYGFGELLLKDAKLIRKYCLWIGLGATGLFLVFGTMITLRKSPDETSLPFLFDLMNQRKYPPSQLYLLMTLGPVIALVPWAEKVKGKLADMFKVIGRVPMFFYLMHLLLIHLSAFVVNLISGGNIHQDWYETAPFVGMSDDQRWGLPTLYLVWLIDVIILFVLCKRYAKYKAEHPGIGWMKYI